jgi:hypothetical protein
MTISLKSTTMAFLILFGLLASADAASLLILKSTQSDLPEGGIIDATAMLSIPAGARLTLVGEAGRKITLRGPYSGTAGAAEQAAGNGFGSRMLAALSRLIVGTPPESSRIGAFRGAASATLDDIWRVNVSTTGEHCLRTDIPTRLWRPRADKAAALSIKRPRQTWVWTVWPPGEATLAWPSGVEVSDDTAYLVRLGFTTVNKVTLHLLPSDLRSDFHRAAWMSETGCLRQARLLLSRIR